MFKSWFIIDNSAVKGSKLNSFPVIELSIMSLLIQVLDPLKLYHDCIYLTASNREMLIGLRELHAHRRTHRENAHETLLNE